MLNKPCAVPLYLPETEHSKHALSGIVPNALWMFFFPRASTLCGGGVPFQTFLPDHILCGLLFLINVLVLLDNKKKIVMVVDSP